MAAVTVSIEIDRSAARVFSYATDAGRFREWQEGVVDGHREGDRCLTTRRIGGITRSSTSVVTHEDPPHAWGVRGIDGPLRAAVDLAVEAQGPTRSRVTISVDFAGHGVGKLLVPLVRRQACREMPDNLARLRQQVESAEPRTRSEP